MADTNFKLDDFSGHGAVLGLVYAPDKEDYDDYFNCDTGYWDECPYVGVSGDNSHHNILFDEPNRYQLNPTVCDIVDDYYFVAKTTYETSDTKNVGYFYRKMPDDDKYSYEIVELTYPKKIAGTNLEKTVLYSFAEIIATFKATKEME